MNNNFYSDIKINDDIIMVMNHVITMDELIEQSYFTMKYSVAKCRDLFNLLYINNNNIHQWYEFNKTKYNAIMDKHDIIKPICDRIIIINPELRNTSYFRIAKIDVMHIKSNEIFYHKCDLLSKKFHNIVHIVNNGMFHELLKFKLKQERYTRIVRKDLENINNSIKKLENILCGVESQYININENLKFIDKRTLILQNQGKIHTDNLEKQLKIIENNFNTFKNQIKQKIITMNYIIFLQFIMIIFLFIYSYKN
jgi:hypothetical protein